MKNKNINRSTYKIKNYMSKIVSTTTLIIALYSPAIGSDSSKESILMIEVMGSANLVSKAKALDYDVTIFTANKDQRVVSESNLRLADRHTIVDTNDMEAIVMAAEELNKKIKFSAVIPGNEYFVIQSALIAEKLGLRSLSIKAAETARNKDYTLLAMEKQDIATPRFKVLNTPEKIEEHAKYIGFPAILKPVDSAASDKVFKVMSVEEAQEKLQEITMAKDTFEMWGYPMRREALFEEYIPGQEYSIEGIAVGNRPVFYSITTKETRDFVETRHIVGPFEDQNLKSKIINYVSETIQALDIRYAPFHMEVRLNAEGEPRVMEIGTRIPGDCITDVIDLAKDTNFARDYFRMLVDPNCILEDISEAKRFAAIQFFYHPEISRISSFEGLSNLEKNSWVREIAAYKKVGDEIPEKPFFLKRLGHVKFIGDSLEDIEQKSQIIAETVVIN